MRDITTDKRIELIRQIRSQNQQNECDMQNREQLLYGKSSAGENRYPDPADAYIDSRSGAEPQFSTFRLRMLIAMTLLLSVIVLDTTERNPWNISAQKISEVLAVDYEARMEKHLQTFLTLLPERPYTDRK